MSAGAAVLDKPAAAAPPRAEPIPRSLRGVFAWLFWGDFILILMERAVPMLVPVLLKQYKLSDTAISLIMGTIPLGFGLLIMPIISYRSDQLRTRWGRRIPFLIAVTPLIMLALIAIPLSPMLAGYIEPITGGRSITIMFAITITAYTFFNAVCSACYSYLLPDVVPQQFMGRFMSLFRIVTQAGVFLFSYFVMGYAEKHMTAVFIGAAVVYGAGFSLMFLKVREPQYPPPTDTRTVNPIAVFLSYAKHCFRHPLYVWLYAASLLYGISQLAGNLFDVLFMNKTLGLELGLLGKVMAWTSIAVVPVAFYCGRLVDQWRPQRMILVCAVLLAAGKLVGFFVINGVTSYVVMTIINNVFSFFWGVSLAAYLVSIYPKDRYGQFISCSVFLTTIVMMGMNPLCGWFFDLVGNYRYVYLWPAILLLIAAAAFARVNHHWRRCGGPNNYVAP